VRTGRVDPARARDDALDILDDRRFRDDPAPRPLRGPLEWIGDRLRDLRDLVADALDAVPGPTWTAIAAVAVLAAALLVWWLVRRHGRAGGDGAGTRVGGARRPPRETAAALEHAAEDAERAGDFERALRLRFCAGLLRLGERGVIRYRPSLTTGEVRRLLGSETFDDLAARFEEVAYGGERAGVGDVDAARSGWARVVEDASHR
jgi:hypothetical protein